LDKFNFLYDELVQISKEILPYYDIDKIKPHSVYIWTKGENGDNVFDILTEEIMFYVNDHIVIEDAKPIIEKIQLKLKEICQYASNARL
jgi:hypothetical protein